MDKLRVALLASVMALVAGASLAQGGPGVGKGPGAGMQGAGPGASAPGMGMGLGMRAGGGPAARSGSDFTPGWSLMTRQERSEHQERMRSMKSYDECRTYLQQHHEQMAVRAKEKGGKALAQPRRDGCAALQP